MRLIDADALLKELESSELQPTKDTEGFIDGWCEGFNTVVDMINNQPTAYDTEKVVAELEEEREYSYADFEEYVNEKSPCLDAEYDDYFHRGLERAIKLVRKGGA